tara:strand:+ start:4121 stop:5023 length:903 start_codon:yes stop_codon:yes gene_type:complete
MKLLKKYLTRFGVNICTLFFLVSLLFSCEVLLFSKPMPIDGKTTREFPEFLEGTYLLDNNPSESINGSYDNTIKPKSFGNTYLDVELVNNQNCIIYSYTQNHISTIIDSLESWEDISNVSIKGTTLMFKRNDEIEFVRNLTLLENDLIRTERKIIYELDLGKGILVEQGKKDDEIKILFKEDEGNFAVNVFLQKNWVSYVIFKNEKGIEVKYFDIESDEQFEDNFAYYNGITKIKKIQKGEYLATPTNNEFYSLLSEPKITDTWILKRIEEKTKINTIYLILMGVAILAAVLILFRRRKH